MKRMPAAGTLVRFTAVDNKVMTGYVTSRDMNTDTLRVCVGTGNYYTVDRATADVVI